MVGDRTLVIDFDGTICYNLFPRIGPFLKGSVDALKQLRKGRWSLLVTTCRNNPTLYPYPEQRDLNIAKMVAYLAKTGIDRFKVDNGRMGKPSGKWYIDDRGVRFQNNWAELVEFLSLQKEYHKRYLPRLETVSIGVEQCILDDNNKLIEGAKEALSALANMNIRIVLTSYKTNRHLVDSEKARLRLLESLRKRLAKYGIPYHWLDNGSIGKPVANYYIEENMIPFNGSWEDVVAKLNLGTSIP